MKEKPRRVFVLVFAQQSNHFRLPLITPILRSSLKSINYPGLYSYSSRRVHKWIERDGVSVSWTVVALVDGDE